MNLMKKSGRRKFLEAHRERTYFFLRASCNLGEKESCPFLALFGTWLDQSVHQCILWWETREMRFYVWMNKWMNTILWAFGLWVYLFPIFPFTTAFSHCYSVRILLIQSAQQQQQQHHQKGGILGRFMPLIW